MVHEELRAIYDRFADRYEENRGLFDMGDVIADFHRRLPSTPGHLLDLGCGAGEPFPAWFLQRGWQVTGVDFSPRMLEMARRFQPEMKTIPGDICEVEFPDGSFEAVTAIYCLFHIERERHPDLFRKVFRWLKPGGRFLFTYATKEYTGAGEFDGFKEFMGEQLFYSHTTPENLFASLRSAGFTIEAADYRDIGGETFLWPAVLKPDVADEAAGCRVLPAPPPSGI